MSRCTTLDSKTLNPKSSQLPQLATTNRGKSTLIHVSIATEMLGQVMAKLSLPTILHRTAPEAIEYPLDL